MKCVILFVELSLAHGLLAATAVYTNVNELVFGLELPTTNLVAGERLKGTMIVSNASPVGVPIYMDMVRATDTEIGRFVVMDETGNILPRTLPHYYTRLDGVRPGMDNSLSPSKSMRFDRDDVVWHYSGLTNPGNYIVRAVAQLPLTNSRPTVRFEAQTPWIAITVTPRPEGSPPAPHVYADYYAMIEAMSPEARAVFLREQERVEAIRRQMETPSAPHPPPFKGRFPTPPTPRQTERGVSTAATPANEAPAKRTRGFYYGLSILLLVGATAILVWRSRRSHS
jgi:hypothetical protein